MNHMTRKEYVTLYRPVGQAELDLIIDSGCKKFPPRLPEQPIFYPVCNVEYAWQIAKQWNAKNGDIECVTFFDVNYNYLSKYDIHTVGNRTHQEYWIPAEDLLLFNNNIIGDIRFIKKK